MMLEYVLKQVVECFMVVIVKKKVKILDGDFLGTWYSPFKNYDELKLSNGVLKSIVTTSKLNFHLKVYKYI